MNGEVMALHSLPMSVLHSDIRLSSLKDLRKLYKNQHNSVNEVKNLC